VVLLAAFLVARGCAAADKQVSSERAVEIAREAAPFKPDKVQVRFLRRSVPSRGYWAVSLYTVDANGRPKRTLVVLVDARTGDIAAESGG
jgi:hypothetical protein